MGWLSNKSLFFSQKLVPYWLLCESGTPCSVTDLWGKVGGAKEKAKWTTGKGHEPTLRMAQSCFCIMSSEAPYDTQKPNNNKTAVVSLVSLCLQLWGRVPGCVRRALSQIRPLQVGGGEWGPAKATWRAAWNTEAEFPSLMPLSSKRKGIETYLGNCPTLWMW